ncbi:MAG: hypothetical protein P8R42_10355, partial [Candidatus Binatia bacterium]|nr:hypothetical protein [Candidatus Binatia bacterium]
PVDIEIDAGALQPGCEPLHPDCLLPFPSNVYTVADSAASTGLQISFTREALPANQDGVRIDPGPWTENDGFSPGSAVAVRYADVDLAASGAPPITDIARSLGAGSATVVVDADTGERWPHWAELDANAADEVPVLFIRPAKNFPEGHRIVVGIRRLVDSEGNDFAPTDVFRAYRDDLFTGVPAVEDRRAAMDAVFETLAGAGVDRSDLLIAWDFTVISTENLTGPLLSIRDQAFEILGDASPTFAISEVSDVDSDRWSREVKGTFEVPLFLEQAGEPGSILRRDPLGQPTSSGTFTARFVCGIPPPGPGLLKAMVYGHGLLGTGNQALSSGPGLVAREFGRVSCGTDLVGMADEDTINAIVILQDISTFRSLADRLLQGHLNTLFLGRLMIHPDGFGSDPTFAGLASGNDADLQYYGISQGGIMGVATTAVATDWSRAVLGVPGINYSTLLNRSVDFDPFFEVMQGSYASPYDQALILMLIQMLWDRGEGNGYANHLADDPLPGTAEDKRILLHVAFGDHQVANVTTDVLARTMGIPISWPAIADGRHPDVEPYWGLDRLEAFPHAGSALVIWDSGIPAPPTDNIAPREGDDPHDDPRGEPISVEQRGVFLDSGTVIDVCGGLCTAEQR